jgi:hypothetical protein
MSAASTLLPTTFSQRKRRETRPHHVEQALDVVCGMSMFPDTPFSKFELLAWRPESDGRIDLVYAELHRPVGHVLGRDVRTAVVEIRLERSPHQ